MKNVVKAPFDWAGDATRKVYVGLLTKREELASCPKQRLLMDASAAVTCATLLLVTSVASAADGGIAGMVDTAANQGDSIKTNFGKLFAAAGFIGAGWGGWNMWRKGKEGEQSQIKGGQIWTPILGGAVLGAIGYVLIKAGETIGIQSSAQGQLPS